MEAASLGKKIKKVREQKCLSQKALAEKIGICRKAYIDFEKGRSFPKFDKVMELTKFLNISIA